MQLANYGLVQLKYRVSQVQVRYGKIHIFDTDTKVHFSGPFCTDLKMSNCTYTCVVNTALICLGG